MLWRIKYWIIHFLNGIPQKKCDDYDEMCDWCYNELKKWQEEKEKK